MSDANRVALIYVPEVTYGTTPTNNSGWKTLRMTGETLGYQPTTKATSEIRADRMVSDLVKVGSQASGDIKFEFSAKTFDDMIEAVLMGAWTSNVLKTGTSKKSFSVEKRFLDITKYQIFTGVRAGKLDLDFKWGAIATGTLAMMGNGSSIGATSAVGTGTVAAADTSPVTNGSVDITGIKIDGTTASAYFEEVKMTIDPTLRARNAIGSDAPYDIANGRSMITGTLNSYFSDATLYGYLLDNSSHAFEFTVGDGTNSYTFSFPKVKFTSGSPDASQVDTDVMLPLGFQAIYDSVTGTDVTITRVVG